MASSSNVSPDLTLAPPGNSSPSVKIWRPSFDSITGPLTVKDSVMRNDGTASIVAWNISTPEDEMLLAERSDKEAMTHAMASCVQSAASVSNLAKRLAARNYEVEVLKKENQVLREANQCLHAICNRYSTEMKDSLDWLESRSSVLPHKDS